jgi:DNA-binding IclR family transcriptional regulator
MNGRSAERAARVLELLGAHAKPLPAMMISRELAMPRSTTYHLLNVLRQRGFVSYQEETRRWGIGAKAVEIATQAPSIGQAVAVMEAFDRASDRLSLEEVADRSRLSRPATARTLAQLQEHGLIAGSDGRYWLGLRLATMAARIAPVDQLRTVARPLLTDLRDETGETANLLVRDGTSVIYLDQVESRHTLRHSGWTGLQIPVEGTASGAALRGATAPQVVRDAIEPGVTAIACRVVWPLLVTAVGITGPTARLDAEKVLSCCGAVARVAEALSEQLADAKALRPLASA